MLPPRLPRRVVSRSERSHCPSQTVKKLLEEQRRRQQQPDAGGVPGQFPPPLAQSLTPSVNESEAGHSRFPVHQETVGSGLGSLAPTTGFPDWDPNTHAAYTDSPYSYPASAAEGFPTPDFYPPSDPGWQCSFSVGMEAVINSGVQVDLEARDFEGLTPLHTAILALNVAMHPPDLCPRVLSTQARDRLACVQMLLHMGADHTSQEIKSNKTVLHLAVQAANPTLVQLLLELPQGDLRAFVNMKAHGNTALHMAAALPPGPPQEAIVRRLLAAGADPTLRNLENEQPVHLLRPGPGPEGVSMEPTLTAEWPLT
ncbi:hypothetical protein GH733_012569 [Mirounga leonina]|nr:hypothetical protein GH733_012569 [Mirounga leonina]